jgi:hypothetical protein
MVMYSEMTEFFRVLSIVLFGWGIGFLSYAIIDCFRITKEIKVNKERHDMEMARIKASRSVAR